MFSGFEVAFAAKPVFHGGLEAVEGDVVAGFEQAIGDGEGVVKDGVVGEVAHGKIVDPVERAGSFGTVGGEAMDGNFAHEHASTLVHGQLRAWQSIPRG